MEFIYSKYLQGIISISGKKFVDDRGYFCETFRSSECARNGLPEFIQENHSMSSPGVFRGLHYQINPNAQGKLVYCVSGEIWDYVVDIRSGSKTYGRWDKFVLNGNDTGNVNMVYIPPGFAHGFFVVGNSPAHVVYKVTSYYSKENERAIRWNDPFINIDCIGLNTIVSSKDSSAPLLCEAENNF